jgi:hypothetical protein
MSDAAAAGGGKIDIGRVIKETFAVVGRNFKAFFTVALILAGVPGGLTALIQLIVVPKTPSATFEPSHLIWLPLVVLVSVVGAVVLQAVLVHATVKDREGVRPAIGESLSIGLRAFWPLVGLGILSAIGCALGFMLLVVPGIILVCAWCVAAPALITEDTGVVGALKRSAALTRGNRWRIFGLGIVVLLIVIGVRLAIGLVSGLAAAAAAIGGGGDGLVVQGLSLVFNIIVQTLSTMLGAAGSAVLFVELREKREGRGSERLSDVFA